MKKLSTIFAIVSLILISTMLVTTVYAAPTIKRPMEIIEATINGGNPVTIDPAALYDTASGEFCAQMYDTLIAYNAEHLDTYIPQLASSYSIINITGTTGPDGIPYYYQYDFKMRTDAKFWDGNTVTAADVEFNIERMLLQSFPSGPSWMYWEPILNGADNYDGTVTISGNTYDMAVTADVSTVGLIIDQAVGSNATDVWINIMFHGTFPALLQILSSPWASVYEKSWAVAIDREGNWNGEWGADHTAWLTAFEPATDPQSPWDIPTEVGAMGSGPFIFEAWDNTLQQWSVNRNPNYWQGFPSPWPALAGAKPAGYINHYVLTWAYDWAARETMFLAGDVDYCAVPRANMLEVLGQPGIRCIFPLPQLAVDGAFFTFDINPACPFGTINAPGVFTEGGLPSDFFGNAVWGNNVRHAFAQIFDPTAYIQAAYLGEAVIPPTAICQGLPYYDASVKGFSLNITEAIRLLKTVPGLWDTGFTIPLVYNSGNIPRQTFADSIKAAVEALGNPKFHATVQVSQWGSYSALWRASQCPMYVVGWLVDYPDPNDFVVPFYKSLGTFSFPSGYNNPTMDALISQGIATPDGPARQAVYTQLQELAIADCPSFTIAQSIGRHFERDWITGWYFNTAYSGQFAYNTWKWYYVPQALFSSQTDSGYNSNLPTDVNYDGVVNILDVSAVAGSFGQSFGPPIGARWVFRADIDNNRVINILDIASVARQFTKTSPKWTAAT